MGGAAESLRRDLCAGVLADMTATELGRGDSLSVYAALIVPSPRSLN